MEIKKIEFQKQEQAKPNPNESNEQSKAQKSGVENKEINKKEILNNLLKKLLDQKISRLEININNNNIDEYIINNEIKK